MSLARLLHDDDDLIVVMPSRKLTNGDDMAWNQYAMDCAAADRTAAHLARNHNVVLKHALHDGVRGGNKDRPQCQAEHFLASRSFFIDCDTHGGSPYTDMKQVAAAFKSANGSLHQLGLPTPNLLQGSGAGLQAVWVVDQPIPAKEWGELQRKLLLLFKRFHLEVDMGVTSIGMGVRYCGPGFRNFNHGQPLPTEVYHFDAKRVDAEQFKAFVEANAAIHIVGKTTKRKAKNSAYADIDFQVDLSLILNECKVIEHAISTGGADDGYVHWQRLVGLCSKNHDEEFGRKLAHEISYKHEKYTADETDGRFDNMRDSDVTGTTRCELLAEHGAAQCAACKWNGKITSPTGIQKHVRPVPDAALLEYNAASPEHLGPTVTNALALPNLNGVDILNGYYFNDFAGVRRKPTKDEVVGPIVWSNIKLSGMELRQSDIIPNQQYLCFNYAPVRREDYQSVTLDTANLSTPGKMVEALGGQGVILSNTQHKPVQTAMSAWVTQLQEQKNRATRYSRLGWTQNSGFVMGRSVYLPSGEVLSVSESNEDLRAHDPHGDYDAYGEVVETLMATETRPEAHCFLAGSLSSVLLHLMGSPGIALNWYSIASGYGKSTLALLAASMWGWPTTLMFTLDDTGNSIMRRLSELNNLPAIYDEIRLGPHNQKTIIDLIFRLTSNTEKSRMETGGKVQVRGTWRAPILFATNYSFIDLVKHDKGGRGGDAAIARVMDFRMPPLPDGARENAPKITMSSMKLHKNNGWTGHQFVRYVVQNQTLVEEALQRVAGQLFTQAHRMRDDVSGRNHAFAGAAMIVAATICETQKIFPLNARLVKKAVTTAIDITQEVRVNTRLTHDPLYVMRDYLAAMERHRITTITGGTRRIEIDTSRVAAMRPFLYEVRYPDEVVIVIRMPFRRWLEQQGFPVSHILDGLAQYQCDRSLCKGVKHMSQPVSECYEFRATGLFEGYFKD